MYTKSLILSSFMSKTEIYPSTFFWKSFASISNEWISEFLSVFYRHIKQHGFYNLLNLMLDILELVRHVLALPHHILYFFDLVQLIHKHLIALLQAKSMALQLFGVILKGIHDNLPHLGLELKPLRCLRIHYMRIKKG